MTDTRVRAPRARIWSVIRMQLVNRQTYVWLPLIILGSTFVLSLIIFALVPYDGPKWGGGSQAPLWYFGVTGIQALTLTFPFSQAMSVTRREFFLGTLLTAAFTSTVLAVVFVVGGLLELATRGWGVNGYFFYLDWVWAAGPFAALLVYFTIAMLFFVIGFWAATIYKRSGALGVTVVLVAIGAVLVGLIWLTGLVGAWPQVGAWLANAGAFGLALWGLVLLAVLAVASFLTLRRATP